MEASAALLVVVDQIISATFYAKNFGNRGIVGKFLAQQLAKPILNDRVESVFGKGGLGPLTEVFKFGLRGLRGCGLTRRAQWSLPI